MGLTHGELFAGIGGFSEAGKRVGIKTLWAVEIDEQARRVLRHHDPDVLILEDVREVGAHNLPPVDIITFGSPCQDLSVAGRREGFDGERSALYFEAIRVIAELRPAFAVWENVPGALSSNSGRDFGAALDALAELGALDIAWRILDAQYFGVAQRRRRVFVVADFRGERAGEILFEPEGVRRDTPPRREAGTGTAKSVGASASGGGADVAGPLKAHVGNGRGWCVNAEEAAEGHLIPILEAGARQGAKADERDGLGIGQPGDPMFSLQASKQHGIAVSLRGRDGGATAELGGDVSPAVRSSQGGGDKPHVLTGPVPYRVHGEHSTAMTGNGNANVADPVSVARSLDTTGGYATNQGGNIITHPLTAEGHDASEDGTGRGTPIVAFAENQRGEVRESDVALSLSTAGGKPGSGYPASFDGMMVRRLTPTECSRLQGFPDDFLDLDPPLSDSAKYRLLGNAVAVPVVQWILARIADYERSTP